ncbi:MULTISPECIES: tRNA lysidine(34) synthetase TilS [unclassified Bacillus (in: firmicutes)]|uniref:tRNA lysidine(34) synthetase TilS n=1 Tax=unclassified Bacillus (in: firmicutes) TaxID=185979 RepID=UPI0008E7FB08|nr:MULTISPECIES: tRNA lysidine(34) synthetase TilS [unclassified Bacillus (in: firmicutes)]SFB22932.1 tRNA(Ile)-lysidine synthase [Bacillus sp. UNCCL13]SFQ91152.1 tRNA(Ile)-lysidine synthase [Bacillus sp. cl95]
MFETNLKKFVKQHNFSFEDKRIVVGVSGGPDSMALLHFLNENRKRWNISLVAAHVDHMFRGEESFADAVYVKDYCEQRGIPFEMAQINVPEVIAATGKSSQVAARECRYAFFAEVLKRRGCDWLALAHHGDDQIETILMRLTRGSTGAARAGIPFIRSFEEWNIVRPLLDVTKEEIREYCDQHGLSPRNDPSNEKGYYGRNRFRKHVVPFLKSENPLVHQHFQRFSEEIQEDEALLQELTALKMNTVIIKRENGRITADIETFAAMPMPLQRRGIQLILNYLYKEKPASLSAVHIDQALSLLHRPQPSGTLDFPNGLKIIRSYQRGHFILEGQKSEAYCFELTEPGTIILPNGRSLTMEYTDNPVPSLHSKISIFAMHDMKKPFIIRSRQNGDRMTLKGMAGTRKIKDIFIDQKIPLNERESWPIVTNGEGKILWLPGLKKSAYEDTNKCANSYILFTYN